MAKHFKVTVQGTEFKTFVANEYSMTEVITEVHAAVDSGALAVNQAEPLNVVVSVV